MTENKEVIHTKIWSEVAESENPFAAVKCYCSGYDVYGDLLGKISWIEYLFLLFQLELPSQKEAKLLELIAVAIANPGIRDHSVRAAMNGGVAGSVRASSLMAALAVGAGNLGGGREIFQMHKLWGQLGENLDSWISWIQSPSYEDEVDVWHDMEHIPGFDPNGVRCSLPVIQTLDLLSEVSHGSVVKWLRQNRERLEQRAGYPLAMTGVVVAGFCDLGFSAAQSEMLYLLLRLPGAAAHSLEQESKSWNKYPFFTNDIKQMSEVEYQAFLAKLGDDI